VVACTLCVTSGTCQVTSAAASCRLGPHCTRIFRLATSSHMPVSQSLPINVLVAASAPLIHLVCIKMGSVPQWHS
jgi:hypothetical protein